MLNLLWKDFYFNKRQIALGILFALGFSVIIADGQQFSSSGILMIPSLLFSFMVGKMCQVEDQKSVFHFLSSLPVKKSEMVMSKFVMSYVSLLLGLLIMLGANVIAKFFTEASYQLLSMSSLMILAFVIVYNGVYLFINFKFGYAQAQHTIYVILAAMILCFSLTGNYAASMPVQLLNNTMVGLATLFTAVLFNLFMMVLAIRAYEQKE